MTDKTIGERLRRRRRELGISTAEFGRLAARAAGRPKPISASAIRNQENGTNGIPYALVDPYAEILKVPAAWLLWGVSDATPPPPDDGLAGDMAPLREIRVADSISAGWTEVETSQTPITLFMDIPAWEGVPLVAYEVVGDSLAPLYARGTYLICAPARATGVRDGDHIIVWRVDNLGGLEVPLRTLREVKALGLASSTSADLLSLGATSQPPIRWFTNGSADLGGHIYAEAVVVATYRIIPPLRRGRPLTVPDYLEASEELWLEPIEAPTAKEQNSD